MSLRTFASRATFALVATTVTIVGAALLIRAGQIVLLLLVGALCGVLVDGAARAVARVVHTTRRRAARIVLFASAATGATVLALCVPRILDQARTSLGALPAMVGRAEEALRADPWGRRLLESLPPPDVLLEQIDLPLLAARASSGVLVGLTGLVLVLLVGVWLGLSPGRYLRPAVHLLPEPARPRAVEVASAAHRALQLWLIGRLVDMTILASLTALGLSLLGLPYALVLGVLAGLFEFVPYIGPFFAVAPIALTALATQPDLVMPALLVYFGLQMFQSYVVTPLVEQKAVEVPPALGISAQVVASWVAGPLGLLLATPTIVLVTVIVQSLWIEDAMQEDVRVLGQPE